MNGHASFARCLIALVALVAAPAVEIPPWIEAGILQTETRSTIKYGVITYTDQRIGEHGELGPYQMTRAAFDVVARKDERFIDLLTDMELARDCYRRYITWLYNNYSNRDWVVAATRWNIGPHGGLSRGNKYIGQVLKAARRAGYETP